MFRKRIFGILAALAIALTFATSALAAPATNTDTPPPVQPPRQVGQITAIDDHSFTVEGPQGRTATIQTDDKTRFRFANGDTATFDDLQTGAWVTGRFEPTDARGVFLARTVVILPEDFDPARWKDTTRHTGKVTATDKNSLTLKTRDGQTLTFQINDKTRFRDRDGAARSFADIRPDMPVLVITRQGENDNVALLVGIGAPTRPPSQDVSRRAGKVTAIDKDSLTLKTRDGKTLTFQINDQTCVRDHDGTVQSLADIQPGMPVLIIARPGENEPVALLVGIGAPKQP